MKHLCKNGNKVRDYSSYLCAMCRGVGAIEIYSEQEINDLIKFENETPRRSRLDRMVSAEKAIYEAMQSVEKSGAHINLTDAITLLQQAKDKVSDWVDELKATP